MIKKLLIANRGEIACRIAHTAKALNIPTVAIYSESDAAAKHVNIADEAVFIGPSSSSMSYLNIERVLEAARITGANAIHPGYGFLSENYAFAKAVAANNLIFIGPSHQSIKDLGDKINARKIAEAAGVNIVPGYSKSVNTADEAVKIAQGIGYPVMLKAAAGGGGKGIRIARNSEEIEEALSLAQSEAMHSFADSRTFIEKYIENPRHIEIQILGDKFGNYVCLGERECSVQRHRQKVIEESPSTFIDDEIREKMYAQSIALSKKADYFSAGTVEFIMDNQKRFYFMEMNTRIQVEHPVTEQVTGIDIVEQMLRIARNEKLSFSQKDVKITGHSTECRICAEDPSSGFLPSTGTIITYREPTRVEGVRIDSGIFEGGEVSMFYDSMISKVCTYGKTREESIAKMQNALSQYVIQGISTNISGFLQRIISHPRYLSGDISTHFVEEIFSDNDFTGPTIREESSAVILSASAFIFLNDMRRSLRKNNVVNYNKVIATRWVIVLDGKKYPIVVRAIEDGYKIKFEQQSLYIKSSWKIGSNIFHCEINEQPYSMQVHKTTLGYDITFMDTTVNAQILTPRAAELTKYIMPQSQRQGPTEVRASMNGSVTSIKVESGEFVKQGTTIMSIEAMKMENIVASPIDGIVKEIKCKVGDFVVLNAELAIIEPAAPASTQHAKPTPAAK